MNRVLGTHYLGINLSTSEKLAVICIINTGVLLPSRLKTWQYGELP